MRIIIDANLPSRLFIHIPKILDLPNLDINPLEELYGKGVPDIEWFRRYQQEGGKYFLSNDRAIKSNKQERHAYSECGLNGIFMPKSWHKMKRHKQAAFILIKWPQIMEKFQKSRPGEMWLLKDNMSDRQNSFESL